MPGYKKPNLEWLTIGLYTYANPLGLPPSSRIENLLKCKFRKLHLINITVVYTRDKVRKLN